MFRSLGFIALALAFLVPSQAQARTGDFLFSNKLYGAVSAGAGVYFLVQANKARQDGDEAYELYELAGSGNLAREFYDESREKDTKAAIMLGLGVGTIVYGFHLFMKGDSDKLPDPKMDRGLVEVKGIKLDAGTDPVSGKMGVLLRRSF